tara:strand:- start:1249 stop:2445 length:1197 start_codon:yes stop_codon:yes gene_type:complete
MKKLLSLIVLFVFSFSLYSQILPCTLNGASVYVDNNSNPRMMNASVNGMSLYTYQWTDTNGIAVGNTNQQPFYTQWCVTITDNISGCDTTICQDCIGDSNALCMCPMIYMPVCGCDGVMYSNYCLADCADVPWVPAMPSGQLGGFLPCSTWNPNSSLCEVEIIGDTIVCSSSTPHTLTASPTVFSNPFVSYLWNNGQSNSPILTISTSGNYCVTATDSTGCVSTACINVSFVDSTDLSPLTIPNPPVICLGDSLIIEVIPNFISFWWNTGNPNDTDQNMVVVYPTQDFTYVVEAVDVNGCESREEIEVFVDTCTTTVAEISNMNLDIYPNPTNGNLFINFPNGINFSLEIYDITGSYLIYQNNILNEFVLDSGVLEKGIYLVNITNESFSVTKKLFVY